MSSKKHYGKSKSRDREIFRIKSPPLDEANDVEVAFGKPPKDNKKWYSIDIPLAQQRNVHSVTIGTNREVEVLSDDTVTSPRPHQRSSSNARKKRGKKGSKGRKGKGKSKISKSASPRASPLTSFSRSPSPCFKCGQQLPVSPGPYKLDIEIPSDAGMQPTRMTINCNKPLLPKITSPQPEPVSYFGNQYVNPVPSMYDPMPQRPPGGFGMMGMGMGGMMGGSVCPCRGPCVPLCICQTQNQTQNQMMGTGRMGVAAPGSPPTSPKSKKKGKKGKKSRKSPSGRKNKKRDEGGDTENIVGNGGHAYTVYGNTAEDQMQKKMADVVIRLNTNNLSSGNKGIIGLDLDNNESNQNSIGSIESDPKYYSVYGIPSVSISNTSDLVTSTTETKVSTKESFRRLRPGCVFYNKMKQRGC